MTIKIYTYPNPYEIDKEYYWQEIKDCPHFCVSQTMLNGMREIYNHYKDVALLSTVNELINALYDKWNTINTKVSQFVEVDNAIDALEIDSDSADYIKNSLHLNTANIAESIRILKSLEIDPNLFSTERMTADQQYLVKIYRNILNGSKVGSFEFKRSESSNHHKEAIIQSIKKTNKDVFQPSQTNMSSIVIHGVHQFTPEILAAIEDLNQTVDVVLLFNYQAQYKAVYETWLNIYHLFDKPIIINEEHQFRPISLMTDSYESNILADNIGKVSDGNYSDVHNMDVEIIEFDNLTEFANYASSIYQAALNRRKADRNGNKPVISYMSEQLYSTSLRANDILRAYFPEQFGERHFLDYPLGHFILSTANMWDEHNGNVLIKDLADIKICLNSGILSEKDPGVLICSFNAVEAYVSGETSLEGMCKRLKGIKKYAKDNDNDTERSRMGYFNVNKEDLSNLIAALTELNSIITGFYGEYSTDRQFNSFYFRIRQFLTKCVHDDDSFNEEVKQIVSELLDKLESADIPESGSFMCLKQTMSFYLSQNDTLYKGAAQWIIRGFEQIDGDILRSAHQDASEVCYHFCCLSDSGMCGGDTDYLPWPLTLHFFENVDNLLDWKYMVYIKSKMEYSNFHRYALLYGLEFNRTGYKLSYIKKENENKLNDIYYILRILGVKPKVYKPYNNSNYHDVLNYGKDEQVDLSTVSFSELDRYKYAMCPYRFAIEGLVQGKTVFRSRFLMHHYLRMLVGDYTKDKLDGKKTNPKLIIDTILEGYKRIEDKFSISDPVEKVRILAAVNKNLHDPKAQFIRSNGYFLNNEKNNNKSIRHDILFTVLKDVVPASNEKMLDSVRNGEFKFKCGNYCMYCSSADICLHSDNSESWE